MRILMLTQVLPYPLASGPQIKTHYVLRYLARHHRITLVSFVRSDGEARSAEALRPYCEAIHTVLLPRSGFRDGVALLRAMITGEPFVIARDHRPALYRLLEQLNMAGSFDAVHADQLNMAPYALPVRARRVLDAHNAVWQIAERLARAMPPGPLRFLAAQEAQRLRRYEGRICRAFDHVVAVSESDRAALEEAAGEKLPILVVPIALDPEDFPPIPREPGAKGVLHIGGLHWPPNAEGIRWFLREVWGQVRAAVPEARLFLVGARPPADLRAWAIRDPSVIVPGFVADPTAYWRQSAVVIVPLHAGSGIRVKILEAWSRGMPVVSTTIGCEGLKAYHRENIWIADDPEGFARAVIAMLRDPGEARRIGEAGQETIRAFYDYRVACRPLDTIYPR